MKGYFFVMRPLVLVAFGFAVAGCGGGGGGGGTAAVTSQFMGEWSGGWIDSEYDAGRAQISVTRGGVVTLELSDYWTDAHGTGKGLIRADGSFSVTYQYVGGTARTATGTLTQTGTTLRGSLTVKEGGVTIDTARVEWRRI